MFISVFMSLIVCLFNALFESEYQTIPDLFVYIVFFTAINLDTHAFRPMRQPLYAVLTTFWPLG